MLEVHKPYISIVIPAFNEEHRIYETLKETCLFFSLKNYPVELLLVDDGSNDNTEKVVSEFFKKNTQSNITYIYKKHDRNQGKGKAVQTGILAATGSYILLIDADGATPISEFDKLQAYITDYPIVIGSRDIGTDARTLQGTLRRLIGKSAKLITKLLFNLPVRDTQCGFKLLESKMAQNLATKQITERFGYDVEYLVRAQRDHILMKEVGIVWNDKAGGKVHPLRDSIRTCRELLRIKRVI